MKVVAEATIVAVETRGSVSRERVVSSISVGGVSCQAEEGCVYG